MTMSIHVLFYFKFPYIENTTLLLSNGMLIKVFDILHISSRTFQVNLDNIMYRAIVVKHMIRFPFSVIYHSSRDKTAF
jgi:hypothetical protein